VAEVRPTPVHAMPRHTGPSAGLRVSVVIPTCRRPDLLRRCLAAVIGQRLPSSAFEVIVVDDGHDDETRRLVESAALDPRPAVAVRYLRPQAGRGPAVARNTGWRAALAPLIAFTDDDTVPRADWLAQGTRAMQQAAGIVAMCGRVRVPLAGAPTDHALMTQGLERAEFVTANAFVRRGALILVGGFDERFTRPWREDSDLQFRLMAEAGPMGRCERAVVVHPVRPVPWGISLRQQRNSFFEPLLYKKHPRLYRERIRRQPPWNYYAIVALALAFPLLLAGGRLWAAAGALVLALLLVLQFAWRRLRRTSHSPSHVLEMLATSALIPFASVYWRLRGALHFRVPYL